MQASLAPATLDRDTLLQQAKERTGLNDFGDTWFLEPMTQYLASLNSEGRLTKAGAAGQTEVIVKGLASRLRMIDDIKRHPEILEEDVSVAGIILGLPPHFPPINIAVAHATPLLFPQNREIR